jgi:hypothetical protein
MVDINIDLRECVDQCERLELLIPLVRKELGL